MQTETVLLNTNQFAARFMVKPESVRSAYSRDGHYYGIRPTKLPNGRLAWPTEAALIDRGAER
ncbi:hypothetical protein [Castellaniella sp.]|uniref:hypothetical protein n=1 Tax=Castellaniella sp. TaxID=1955812 RepID=UPI002AFE0CC3|nr:hypothetical protein [Castellaniella sp.]